MIGAVNPGEHSSSGRRLHDAAKVMWGIILFRSGVELAGATVGFKSVCPESRGLWTPFWCFGLCERFGIV